MKFNTGIIIYTDCSTGDIRLVDGIEPQEGRVEVCYEEVWGTVCSDNWNIPDATVACRQLGFSSSGKHYTRLLLKILLS